MAPLQGTDDGTTGYGVEGTSGSGVGVEGVVGTRGGGGGKLQVARPGSPQLQAGVVGYGYNPAGSSGATYGVYGSSISGGDGVYGTGTNGVHGFTQGKPGYGVLGENASGTGVLGVTGSGSGHPQSSKLAGVWGDSDSTNGVYGSSASWNGVEGDTWSPLHAGVAGVNNANSDPSGSGFSAAGVYGYSNVGMAVYGTSGTYGVVGAGQTGVIGRCNNNGIGVWAYPDGPADSIYTSIGQDPASNAIHASCFQDQNGNYIGNAGLFEGNVNVLGSLVKSGGGFKIDHPADPANRYLAHSFVESPEMKNVYDGIVTLGRSGEAEVKLPKYFEALNRDFRYQLTSIGAPGPNLHIRKGVSRGSFKIAGGKRGMKVSWQVTGIRKDRWAERNRLVVEERKPAKHRGHYLHPRLYGKPENKGLEWGRNPERMRNIEEAKKHMKKIRPPSDKPATF